MNWLDMLFLFYDHGCNSDRKRKRVYILAKWYCLVSLFKAKLFCFSDYKTYKSIYRNYAKYQKIRCPGLVMGGGLGQKWMGGQAWLAHGPPRGPWGPQGVSVGGEAWQGGQLQGGNTAQGREPHAKAWCLPSLLLKLQGTSLSL